MQSLGNFGILKIETGDALRPGAVNENYGVGSATFAGIAPSIFVDGRDAVNVELGRLTGGARQGGLDVQEGVLPLDANGRAFLLLRFTRLSARLVVRRRCGHPRVDLR